MASTDREGVTEGVQTLLRERITSYEELKALLLMRDARDRPSKAESLAASLGMPLERIEAAVASLCKTGLIRATTKGYLYDPRSLETAVDKLARAYDLNRLEIAKLMDANAIERVRIGATRVFAGAFTTRPEKTPFVDRILGKDRRGSK